MSQYAHDFAEHFSSWLPNQSRGSHDLCGIGQRMPNLVEIDAAEADHGSVRHFDSAEAVLTAQRHAPAEVFERRAHSPLRIGRIAKAAERASFRLSGARTPSMGEAALMLFPTSFDIAQGEENVSSQMMKASEFERHRLALGHALRLVQ